MEVWDVKPESGGASCGPACQSPLCQAPHLLGPLGYDFEKKPHPLAKNQVRPSSTGCASP